MANLGSSTTPIKGEQFELPDGHSFDVDNGDLVWKDSNGSIFARYDEGNSEFVIDSISATTVDADFSTHSTEIDDDYTVPSGKGVVVSGPITGSGSISGDGNLTVFQEGTQLSGDVDGKGFSINNISNLDADTLEAGESLVVGNSNTEPTIDGEIRRSGSDILVRSGGGNTNMSNLGFFRQSQTDFNTFIESSNFLDALSEPLFIGSILNSKPAFQAILDSSAAKGDFKNASDAIDALVQSPTALRLLYKSNHFADFLSDATIRDKIFSVETSLSELVASANGLETVLSNPLYRTRLLASSNSIVWGNSLSNTKIWEQGSLDSGNNWELSFDLSNVSTVRVDTKGNFEGYSEVELTVGGNVLISYGSGHSWTTRAADVSGYSGINNVKLGANFSSQRQEYVYGGVKGSTATKLWREDYLPDRRAYLRNLRFEQ